MAWAKLNFNTRRSRGGLALTQWNAWHYASSLTTAQRALHDWHNDGHELWLGDLGGVATRWAPHARVGTLPSGALVLAVRVPAIPVVEMSALGHVPPNGILPDRPQADGTHLLFLRGRAELLPHVVASEPAPPKSHAVKRGVALTGLFELEMATWRSV